MSASFFTDRDRPPVAVLEGNAIDAQHANRQTAEGAIAQPI
jgi:hypothetical protein